MFLKEKKYKVLVWLAFHCMKVKYQGHYIQVENKVKCQGHYIQVENIIP